RARSRDPPRPRAEDRLLSDGRRRGLDARSHATGVAGGLLRRHVLARPDPERQVGTTPTPPRCPGRHPLEWARSSPIALQAVLPTARCGTLRIPLLPTRWGR